MNMSKIAVLDQNTINQIAAGEVVERPASVVKELIENAIDAGANAITAEIKEGGISFIRITDNGAGIEKEDIPLAFLRHSTSKIRTVEDLITIGSLGFRGEALSSIASVAQVELITKTRASFTGCRYVMEGGEEKELQEIGCPDGTTFLIRNLFYNTPARRKFLKSPTTEAGYINDLMERLAVSHPNISFKFINNNKTVLHTSGNHNLKDIIYHVYGRDVANQLVPVVNQNSQISLEGYAGKPLVSRGNRNFENYFINGRYIKSAIITKAIEEAYKPYTMQHKYPFTAIHFTVDPELIDVNVHPTKMEIRFTNGDMVYRLTYDAIAMALSGKNMIPDVRLEEEKKTEKKVYENVPEPFETGRINQQRSMEPLKSMQPLNSAERLKSMEQQREALRNKAERKREEAIREMNQSHLFTNTMESGKSFTVPVTGDMEANKDTAFIKDTEIMKLYEAVKHGADLIKKENEEDKERIIDEKSESSQDKNEVSVGANTADHQLIETDKIPAEIVKEDEVYVSDVTGEAQSTLSGTVNSNIIEHAEQTELEGVFLSKAAVKKHRIIGQLFSTYWMVEYDQQLYMIDQHAAHEKILYEATIKRMKDKEFLSQMISPPIILTLNMKEEAAVTEHKDILLRLGYEIEHFGGKEYMVSALPADMYGLAGEQLLIDFIDELVEEAPKGTPDVILEKIASMSCKAAVKGNHNMSELEARSMIDQLLTLDNPFHCPHGRPIIISMTKQEIEKKFKRIV